MQRLQAGDKTNSARFVEEFSEGVNEPGVSERVAKTRPI